MQRLRYDPGEHRRKHCWQQPYADFENIGVAVKNEKDTHFSGAFFKPNLPLAHRGLRCQPTNPVLLTRGRVFYGNHLSQERLREAVEVVVVG